jgi:hypothetical protein
MATTPALVATNYGFAATGGSAAVTASSVVQDTSSSVIVTLGSAMTDGTSNYTVTVSTALTDVAGNALSGTGNTATYSVGVGPSVTGAVATSATTIRLTFSGAMSSSVTIAGNYTLAANGGSTTRTVSAAVQDTPTSAILTINGPLSVGISAYTLTVGSGATDPLSNPVNRSANTANVTVLAGPSITGAIVLSATQVRILFSAAMSNSVATVGNYTISPVSGAGLSITSATQDTTTSALLTLSAPMLLHSSYSIVATANVVDNSTNPVNPSADSVIVGPPTGPSLLSATATSATTLRLVFSSAMSSSVTTGSNYTLTPSSGSAAETISSAVQDSPSSVVLTLSGPMTVGANTYSITASSSVVDTNSNPVNASANTVTYSVAPGPSLVGAVVLALNSVRLLFSASMSTGPVATVSNYTLTAAGGSTSCTVTAAIQDTSSSVVLTLSGNMTVGTSNYTFLVGPAVTDTNTNPVNPSADSIVVSGSTGPSVTGATVVSPTQVRVTFSSPVTGQGTIGNWTVTAAGGSTAVTITAATADTSSSAILSLSAAMTYGSNNYTFTAGSGIQNAGGSSVNTTSNSVTVSGPPPHVAPQVADHYALAFNRLAQQFRGKAGVTNLIRCFTNRANELEQAIADTLYYRTLTTAYGAQLDGIGELLQVDRAGLDDGDYRNRLEAMAIVMSSRGIPDDLLKVAIKLDAGTNPSAISYVEQNYSYEAVLNYTVPAGEQLVGEQFAQIIKRAKPAGVKLICEFYQTDTNLLKWNDDSTATSANNMAEFTAPLTGGIWSDGV